MAAFALLLPRVDRRAGRALSGKWLLLLTPSKRISEKRTVAGSQGVVSAPCRMIKEPSLTRTVLARFPSFTGGQSLCCGWQSGSIYG
jgi:hypothetical protein